MRTTGSLSPYKLGICFALAITCQGCASLYDPLPPQVRPVPETALEVRRNDGSFQGVETDEGKSLRDVIIRIEEQREQLARHRSDQITRDGRMGSTVLLGTLATTATAVFAGPANLIAGFALGTSAVQSTRSLYTQRGYDGTILSANTALGCVSRAGRASLDAHARAAAASARLEDERNTIEQLKALDPGKAAIALGKADRALGTAGGIREGTGSLARQLPISAGQIMDAATTQIARQMPDANAFAAAVQAIGSFTPPGGSAGNGSGEGPTATSATEAVSESDRPLLEAAIASADALVAAIELARTDFTTKAQDALKSCGFTAEKARQPFAVIGIEGNALTLAKGDTVRFQVTGGSGSIYWTILGKKPAGVTVNTLGNTVEIAADKAAAHAGAFILRIDDPRSDSAGLSVNVTIS